MWRNQQNNTTRTNHIVRKSVSKPINNSNNSSKVKSFLPKKHSNMLDTTNVRSFDYHYDEVEEAIIFDIYLYDNNQTNKAFDYCVKNETGSGSFQDDKVYDIFSIAANVLPVYDEGLSEAQGSEKQNHDHYLVQQLKDVAYSAGISFVSAEDLNNSSKAAGATGENAIKTIKCIIHQEERTVIKDSTKTGVYDVGTEEVSTQIGFMNNKVDVEKNMLWLCGAEITRNEQNESESTPYYIKLEVVKYVIDRLYCVAGRTTNTDKYIPWNENDFTEGETEGMYTIETDGEKTFYTPEFYFVIANNNEPINEERIIATEVKEFIGTNCLVKYNKVAGDLATVTTLNIIFNYSEDPVFEYDEKFDYKRIGGSIKEIIPKVQFQCKPGNVSYGIGQTPIVANGYKEGVTRSGEIPYAEVIVPKTTQQPIEISSERIWLEVKAENEDSELMYDIKGIEYHRKPNETSTEYDLIKPKLDWYYRTYPLVEQSTGNTTWLQDQCKKLCESCILTISK